MFFDLVVGNPPYQDERNRPLYPHFVNFAKSLMPQYYLMIIPSRWFAGGFKVLQDFRKAVLSDRRIFSMHDYVGPKDVFPEVSIAGGVCFILWDKNYSGMCHVNVFDGENVVEEDSLRKLDEHDVYVRLSRTNSIVNKVASFHEETLDRHVFSRKCFDIGTNFRGQYDTKNLESPVKVYGVDKGRRISFYVDRSQVKRNSDLIEKWKVLTPKAGGDGGKPLKTKALGGTFISEPGSISTESYIVLGAFETREEALSMESYINTRFVRLLVSAVKMQQNVTKAVFRFVPVQQWNHIFSDEELYERYELTADEKTYIESNVREASTSNRLS